MLCRILTAALIIGPLVWIGAGVLLWAAASSAIGEERCNWASATIGSKHFGGEPGKDYNERNWGLGGEHCLGTVLGIPVRGAAGFFRNSKRIDSFYWGGSATFFRAGPVHAGIAAMLVSGYEIDPIKAVFPVLAIEGERIGVNLSYFPKTSDNVAAVGLQLKWRWR